MLVLTSWSTNSRDDVGFSSVDFIASCEVEDVDPSFNVDFGKIVGCINTCSTMEETPSFAPSKFEKIRDFFDVIIKLVFAPFMLES